MIPLCRSYEPENIFPLRPRRSRKGAALVLVLTLLVLATFLVMAFFGTVSSEFGAAKVDADVEAGRQLADTTVQITMGQIRSATSTAGTAWASQPGMIRTYDDSGQADEVFALYSTAQMRRSVSGGSFDPAGDLPNNSWAADEALWTDLNAPVETRSGAMAFPIIDPRAAAVVSSGIPLIEGFSYDTAGVAGAVAPADLDDADARLPMPVRWIYVLQDGTLTVPLGGSGTTAEFVGPEPIPTNANPIVGRIAFWTDDETSKLNINTALGGVPWDTPIGNSGLEMLFARYQPAKNEFSRYPGHPASVSLAPVFWSFLGMSSPTESLFPSFTPNWDTRQPMASGPTISPAAVAFRDKLFPLIPRNTFGGSAMATRSTVHVASGVSSLAAVDADRLFATPDEILYGPNEAVNLRNENPLGLVADDVRKLSFFVTSQSRSPEVNLFNLPKVGLWPLPHEDRKSVANANAIAGDTRSAVDRLIAFASTLWYDEATKKREYAFTRYDSTNAINDFGATDSFGTQNNEILYDYLDGLLQRPIPGFGGSIYGRYGGNGSRQILTNIYDFIRSNINIVDTSHSAETPTASENLDPLFVSRYAYGANFTGVAKTLASDTLDGDFGQVIPASLANGTRGSGRFPVVSQASLVFIARATNQPPVSGNPMHPWIGDGISYPTFDVETTVNMPDGTEETVTSPHTHPGLRFSTRPDSPGGSTFSTPNARYRGPELGEYETQVEPTFLVSLSLPGAGVPGFRNPFKIRFSGLNNLEVNGASLFAHGAQTAEIPSGNTIHQFHLGPRPLLNELPLLGIPFVVPAGGDSGQTFPFDGGTVTIELLNSADDSVVQTYELTFPPANFPTPLLPNPLPDNFPPESAADLPPSTFLTFGAAPDPNPEMDLANPNFPDGVAGYTDDQVRFPNSPGLPLEYLILPQWPVDNDYRGKLTSDTVRSLEVAFGDVRMISPFASVGGDLFLPHRFYFDSKMRAAHSLRANLGKTMFDHLPGATLQYLTASSAEGIGSIPPLGWGWRSGHPVVPDLWDVATGDDVRRLPYSILVDGDRARTERWPFTASAVEFDSARFNAYKNSSESLGSIPNFATLWEEGGDFTSGMPGLMDGPMLGKVDEGNNRDDSTGAGSSQGIYPYFNARATTTIMPVGPNLFSPNRQVASPVVLGSVLAGYRPSFNPSAPTLASLVPWRTLLFSPNPVGTSHGALAGVSLGGAIPANGTAPDFTLLDFFWMPIVEPYAISDPLSTAGKVNMNSQIAPFTYITRDTALRGVFRSSMVTAVPDKWLNNKNETGASTLTDLGGNSASINYANFRYPINATETLRQFQTRFDAGDIFRSASEICSLWLYPDRRSASDTAGPVWDAGAANIRNWWYSDPGAESKSVTGDNLREKPYATLYPLLTTKSNTYTVHFKVQALQKVAATGAAEWVEGRDRVVSETQGSQTIERYIDPMDSKLIDFATESDPSAVNLGDFYRFRVLSIKRFTP